MSARTATKPVKANTMALSMRLRLSGKRDTSRIQRPARPGQTRGFPPCLRPARAATRDLRTGVSSAGPCDGRGPDVQTDRLRERPDRPDRQRLRVAPSSRFLPPLEVLRGGFSLACVSCRRSWLPGLRLVCRASAWDVRLGWQRSQLADGPMMFGNHGTAVVFVGGGRHGVAALWRDLPRYDGGRHETRPRTGTPGVLRGHVPVRGGAVPCEARVGVLVGLSGAECNAIPRAAGGVTFAPDRERQIGGGAPADPQRPAVRGPLYGSPTNPSRRAFPTAIPMAPPSEICRLSAVDQSTARDDPVRHRPPRLASAMGRGGIDQAGSDGRSRPTLGRVSLAAPSMAA